MRATPLALATPFAILAACSDSTSPIGAAAADTSLLSSEASTSEINDVTASASVSSLAGPSGFTIFSSRRFSSKASSASDVAGAEGWQPYEYSQRLFSIVSQSGAPRSATKVGQMRYPAGFPSTGVSPGQASKQLPAGTKRLYLSFWMKLSSNWQSHSSGVNKIFHIWMTEPSKNRIFLSFYGQNPSALRFTVHAQNTPAGSVNYTQNVGSRATRAGQWQRYEMLLVLNTPGSANGQVHAWVGGQKVIRYTSVRLLYSGERAALNNVQWSPTWGGTGGPAVRQTMYMWLDHAHISGAKY